MANPSQGIDETGLPWSRLPCHSHVEYDASLITEFAPWMFPFVRCNWIKWMVSCEMRWFCFPFWSS
jgi:hypothetical protein